MPEHYLEEVECLIRSAYEKLNVSRTDEPLSSAVAQLVQCAAEGVTLLGRPGISGAGEMLGCARAAVTVATYAMREVDGRDRRQQHAIRYPAG